ncbi:DUF898 domain-containing protein [Pseudomonas sp. MAP12]|uniref:DUF898 domain-containing protein n=1 Tax=Geopseudomonas aromaticivorans TaxID=2849492 RepID=A0ABS6MTJ7_9GAMM|nr:YjgN family protein [Pseudomonas aromaticivorans]MBV2131666.1 DUF898 domain-containing protein [Pseudomonas aromaticivorans]
MSEAVYAVVFRGEVLDGFSKEQVQAAFGRLFKLSAERLDQLFSHPRVVLKNGLTNDEAARYRDALRRIGAVVMVEAPPLARPAPPAASMPGVVKSKGAVAAPAVPLAIQTDAAPAVGQPVAISPPQREHHEAAAGAARIQGDGAPPAAVTARGKDAASAAPRELAFEFRGEGFEFFRIWIVNILLSIVTLGIYSAWAKVRTQRYFYANTQLDGSSFDYLADPLKILKGRLIAFACLVIYSVAGELSVVLGAVMGLLLLVALPWIIVRGLSFRNSNSAWRGVRFGFDGSYGDAAMAFLVWPLLGALTLGILMPLAMHKQQRFIAGNSRYGTSCFQLDVGARPFYMIFLAMLGIGVAAGVLISVLSGLSPVLASAVGAVTYLLLFAFFNVRFTNLVYGNLALGDNHLVSQYELGSYSMLMLVNMLGMLLTLGLFYPWAKVRNARYAAEHMALVACDDLDGFIAARRKEVSSLGGEFADMFDVGLAL